MQQNLPPISPLRYPGAKRWMSGYISRSIKHNDLKPELFVELFAGGASISLAQLHSNQVKQIALVDRDPLVASLWKTIFFDTDWLIDQVWKTEITLEKWGRLRKQKPTSIRQQAFKCLYLNRTSFSGVLAPSAGPIGGKTQNSKYKIGCRFTKETIIERLSQISKYRDRVAFVWNLHWHNAVALITGMQSMGSLPKSILFYLDPPFYKKADSLYTFYFEYNDHINLRNFLVGFEQPWILSYDSCPEVIALYNNEDFNISDVNLIYTASQKGERGIGKELIFSNLPKMVSELQRGLSKKTHNSVHPEKVAYPEITPTKVKSESANQRMVFYGNGYR